MELSATVTMATDRSPTRLRRSERDVLDLLVVAMDTRNVADVRQAELGEQLQMARPNVTRALTGLSRAGWIVRLVEPGRRASRYMIDPGYMFKCSDVERVELRKRWRSMVAAARLAAAPEPVESEPLSSRRGPESGPLSVVPDRPRGATQIAPPPLS